MPRVGNSVAITSELATNSEPAQYSGWLPRALTPRGAQARTRGAGGTAAAGAGGGGGGRGVGVGQRSLHGREADQVVLDRMHAGADQDQCVQVAYQQVGRVVQRSRKRKHDSDEARQRLAAQ